MKLPTVKYEDKIVVYAIIAALAAWVVDAAVDSLVFDAGSFLDSLLLEAGPHETYFRLFILVSFFAFGVVISMNLSRRRRAEEELRKTLSRLEDEKARSEAIIAAIPDGISIQDRSYRVVYQNEVHRSLVGDQVGNLCYEKYARQDAVCPGCPVARSFADGGRHVLEKVVPVEGGTRSIEISSAPLRNARGEIVAGIEAVRDVTERKRTEENLRLFSQAMDEAMDGIQLVDLDGRVLYSNRAVEEIYGYRAEELLGKAVGEMNADASFADAVILPGIRVNGQWSGEVVVKHKDGRHFPVWLSTSMVKNGEGEPIAMVGIIRDITERKRVEEELLRHRERLTELVDERTVELRQANALLQREIAERERVESELSRVQKLESLGLLAGGIAHDFNNLLGSIMGNISLAMLDVGTSSRAYEQLARADRASLRAQELTQQLLTFSRGGTPVKRPVSLAAVIAEAAGFSLRGSRVLHELTLPRDLWPVAADEGQMMQVFNNLLLNADQAMPRGGIIRITGENVSLGRNEVPTLAAGRYVRISVRDEGTGIPKEHLDRIFDPYFTTKQKGSGLGLAATYSIVRRHDGHIMVESELGTGTVFHIFLPASDGEVAPQARPEKALMGSGRVLILDDETDMRLTTGSMLERLGYTVAYAGDGEEAVEMYRTARENGAPFDAVIMDLMIPGGMGGKEAVRRLLEIDGNVRAVVSSGYSQDPVIADFRAYGFCDMVVKPYRIRDLSEVMARVIGKGCS
jgi:PAS domain S-box-containing protein